MYQVVIIGAGQAGLSAAYALKTAGIHQVLLLEQANQIGQSWAQRFNGLTLFTSREYSQLPGLALSGDPQGYASKDEFANYLKRYASTHQLEVKLGCKVTALTRTQVGFHLATSQGEFNAHNVIIATGAFQSPVVPQWAGDLALPQHTINQLNNIPISGETVLVVGDGASGRQLAQRLSKDNKILLATGKRRHLVPQRLFGKDIFYWLDKLGLLNLSAQHPIGAWLKRRDPFPGQHLNLKRLEQAGVHTYGRLQRITNNLAHFADGEHVNIDRVIWALGYRNHFDMIKIPGALSGSGHPIHIQGMSPIEGLYYLSQPWLNNRASALICGLKGDAALLVSHIASRQKPKST